MGYIPQLVSLQFFVSTASNSAYILKMNSDFVCLGVCLVLDVFEKQAT